MVYTTIGHKGLFYVGDHPREHLHMFEKPTAQYPLGLEQADDELKGALLTRKGGKAKILRLFTVAIEQREAALHHLNILHSVNPALPREPLRRALYVTGLSTQQTLIRTLDIKLTKASDIDAVLPFQSEPLIPYPVDQAVLDRVVLSQDENGSQLTVFAVRKDHLQQHLDFFTDLNIEPESVSCYPAALAAFSKEYTQLQEPLFVVHLAAKEITILLVDDGKVLAGHSANQGVGQLIDAANASAISLDAIDFNAVIADPQNPMTPFVEALRIELQRAIFALTKQARGQEIGSILLTGDGAPIGNIGEYLCSHLQKTLVLPTAPFDPDIPTSALQRFAVPIGLALGCLLDSKNCINFRQGELAYPHPWKRLKRPLAAYVVCCVLIAILIFVQGHESQNSSIQDARARYKVLLTTLRVDHSTFEEKAFGTKEADVRPIDSLDIEDLTQRIDWIEQDIQNTSYLFPLNPNIARVGDVLAWICDSPKVYAIDPKTNERIAHIQIENFNYSMVKRPEKTKQKERYQVRIDLEFSSKEPNWAREFNDMLVAPNAFVDPRGELKWSAAQGRYRVSFFLKDKTFYP